MTDRGTDLTFVSKLGTGEVTFHRMSDDAVEITIRPHDKKLPAYIIEINAEQANQVESWL